MKSTLLLMIALITCLAPHTVAQDGPTFTDDLGVTYTVERYKIANYPVAMAFTPDGRLFYTEKETGNVRVIGTDDVRQPEPVITLPTSSLVERGLLGIAVDPNYEDNGYIWVAHIRPSTNREPASHDVVRFYEEDGVGSDPKVMFSIPLKNNALIHHGGNLAFDDEGRLFFTVGDNEDPANSQDLNTVQGAIHRFDITAEGLQPAEGNPDEDNSIFAHGFRNPFDLVIDPYTTDLTRIFATENGADCDDEINMVLRGFDYGAGPDYVCGDASPETDEIFTLPPMISYTPTVAPTGITIYTHEAAPEWQGEVFFCTWNQGQLMRITLNEDRNQLEAINQIDLGGAQCRIDITVTPDGALMFTTVGVNGGEIYRVIPQ
jgi:aldose sugar dehydrogenase